MSNNEKKTRIISTRNIQVVSTKEIKEERVEDYKFMEKLAQEVSEMGNLLMRHHVNCLYRVDEMRKHIPNLSQKEAIEMLSEEIGCSLRNSGYQLLSSYDHIASDIRTNINGEIFKKINKDFNEIRKNKISIPSFKVTSVPIRISNRVYQKDGEYFIDFPLSMKQKKNNVENITFKLSFGRDRSGNEVIVKRILSGTNKMLNSFFKFDDKNKLYLFLVFEEPIKEIKGLDENKILGLDLGITRLVSHHITNIKHQPQQLEYLGKYITDDMVRFGVEYKTIQTGLTSARGGHGRKRKLLKLTDLKDKRKNKNKSNIDDVACAVLNLAKKNNCGVIKMEDLSGIKGGDKKWQFLNNWSYGLLQDKIQRKAEVVGMKVLWVEAKNTSITCPYCGEVNRDNRLINREEHKKKDKMDKKDMAKHFECVNMFCTEYGVMHDADIIASINIANKEGFPVKPSSKAGRIQKSIDKKKAAEEQDRENNIQGPIINDGNLPPQDPKGSIL